MVFIYVLSLKNDKYYVGKTKNPKFRIDTHFKDRGCYWTKKYKPCQIIGLFPDCDDFDEDKYTLKYMSKYGVDNVRGGSFCRCDLSIENKNTIDKMISSSNDCCHFCGEKVHFIGNCTKEKEKNKYSKQNKHFLEHSKDYESADEIEWDNGSDDDVEEQSWSCSYCNKSVDTKKGAQCHKRLSVCKKRKQMKKNMLSSADEQLDKCVYNVDAEEFYWDGEEWHDESTNYIGHRDGTFGNQYGDWRPKNLNKKIQTKKSSSSKCHRCGRNGHYKSSCYANRHIKGFCLG